MKAVVYSYAVLVTASLALHFLWESAHLPLYTGYTGLSGSVHIVLYAAAGDVLYTLFAVVLVALFKRNVGWIRQVGGLDYIGLAVLGFGIALLVEYKALALHRWAYTAAMPIVLGVGLSPLLQMTILLPLCVFLAKSIVYRNG